MGGSLSATWGVKGGGGGRGGGTFSGFSATGTVFDVKTVEVA